MYELKFTVKKNNDLTNNFFPFKNGEWRSFMQWTLNFEHLYNSSLLTRTSMCDFPGKAWSSGLFSPRPSDTSEAIPWKHNTQYVKTSEPVPSFFMKQML